MEKLSGGMALKGSIRIYADLREERSRVIEHLEARGAEVVKESLPVGDFLLSDRVAAERKTAHDFLGSITGKRLYRQLGNLKEEFEAPLLIIEGYNLYGLRPVHPDLIRRTLALITVVHRIPVVFTRDPEDTAGFLFAVARQEQLGLQRKVALRGEKKPLVMEERQRYVVESLPRIGPHLAEELLKHFGSIERIVAASEEELQEVPFIGKKRAREIRTVLQQTFRPE